MCTTLVNALLFDEFCATIFRKRTGQASIEQRCIVGLMHAVCTHCILFMGDDMLHLLQTPFTTVEFYYNLHSYHKNKTTNMACVLQMKKY